MKNIFLAMLLYNSKCPSGFSLRFQEKYKLSAVVLDRLLTCMMIFIIHVTHPWKKIKLLRILHQNYTGRCAFISAYASHNKIITTAKLKRHRLPFALLLQIPSLIYLPMWIFASIKQCVCYDMRNWKHSKLYILAS